MSGLMKRRALICSVLILAGCVTAPQYDDQTDKLISQLQTDVDTEFVSLKSLNDQIKDYSGQTDAASQKSLADAKTKASYSSADAFYQKADVDLISLKTRIDAEPNLSTSKLDEAWQLLNDNLIGSTDSMQSIHKRDTIISNTELTEIQALVDAQIGALLTRELNLKGSQSSGSSGSTQAASTGTAAQSAKK